MISNDDMSLLPEMGDQAGLVLFSVLVGWCAMEVQLQLSIQATKVTNDFEGCKSALQYGDSRFAPKRNHQRSRHQSNKKILQ